MLEAEVTDHLGAERYERTSGRRTYRNGHRLGRLTTRDGSFVDEDKILDGQMRHEITEGCALSRYVQAKLLAGAERLFLRVMPSRCHIRLTVRVLST